MEISFPRSLFLPSEVSTHIDFLILPSNGYLSRKFPSENFVLKVITLQQMVVSLFEKLVSFWMTNGSLFFEKFVYHQYGLSLNGYLSEKFCHRSLRKTITHFPIEVITICLSLRKIPVIEVC